MARKVNKRKATNSRPAGKTRQRARTAKKPASRPPTANGSASPTGLCNGLVVQVPYDTVHGPYDTLGQVTTDVYDGQNSLTRVEEPGARPSPFAPALQRLKKPKQRPSRKRANAKAPKKTKTSAQKRKRG